MNNKISQHYRKTSAEVCMFSIFILFFLLCSGCSKNITAVTSTDDPELRCEKIPSSLSNSEEFWEYAYENIPTVSIDDVESGNYNNTYICIDGIILRNYAEILVAFQKNDGTYCDDSFLPLKTSCKYGYGFITEASSGTSVKICVYVEKSELNHYPLGVTEVNLDTDFSVSAYMKERNSQKSSSTDGYNETSDSEIESDAESLPESETVIPETVEVQVSSISIRVSELLFSGESIVDVTEKDMANGYDYIKDVYISVDEAEKEIDIVVQVPSSTSSNTAKMAGEDVARYLAFMASTANSYYDAPGSDYLGGIYDRYDLLIYVDDGYKNFNLYGAKVTSASKITW